MTEISDDVISEVTHRGRNLLVTELVRLIERGHPRDSPGIDRETLDEYTRALADEPDFEIDPEAINGEVDDSLVATETWVSNESLYDLGDGRISTCPQGWHDRLGGETDVREYVDFLASDESGFADADPYDEGGIPEPVLLEVVPVVGRTDRDAVKAQIEDRRAAGEIIQEADQHPDARVQIDRSTD